MDPIEEWWEERAAIMQFDGGLDRCDAEYAAYALVLRYCEQRGCGLPRSQYFDTHRLGEAKLRWSDDLSRVEHITPRPAWILWEKYPAKPRS